MHWGATQAGESGWSENKYKAIQLDSTGKPVMKGPGRVTNTDFHYELEHRVD